MPTQQLNDKPRLVGRGLTSGEAEARNLAIEQIKRKRLEMRALSAAIATVALVVIWAITEY